MGCATRLLAQVDCLGLEHMVLEEGPCQLVFKESLASGTYHCVSFLLV